MYLHDCISSFIVKSAVSIFFVFSATASIHYFNIPLITDRVVFIDKKVFSARKRYLRLIALLFSGYAANGEYSLQFHLKSILASECLLDKLCLCKAVPAILTWGGNQENGFWLTDGTIPTLLFKDTLRS
jgi:hypothetical protein